MTATLNPTTAPHPGPASRMALEDILHAYRTSQLLITATELGVFERLTGAPRARAELAAACGVEPVKFDALADALIAMDLLREDAAGCTAGPLAAAHLVPDAPSPLRNWVRSEAGKLREFTELTKALAPNGPEPVVEVCQRRAEAQGLPRTQQLSLADIAHDNATSVAAAVEALVPGGRGRLLDAGGGHGGYSIDLALGKPGWSAVIADRPEAVRIASGAAAAAGVADRVTTQVADLLVDDLGAGFDLAFLFMVHCGKSDEQVLRLFGNVREALAPGGWLLIRGFYWRDPLEEALFSLKHYLHSSGRPALSLPTTRELLAAAGYTDIHLLDEAETEPRSLLAARRPEESR